MKDGVRVRVHYGSGNVPAHVALGSGKQLAVGGRVAAQLRLEAPVYLLCRRPSHHPRLVGATDAGRCGRARSRCHAASVSSSTDSSGWNASLRRSTRRPRSWRRTSLATQWFDARAFVKSRFSRQDINAAIEQLVRKAK